ncbi:hypothetical protein FIBSPDRAFT_789082 [Athelia psychrophila]|uniref:BTB domain-containing protein n=1 Tax=Athelia psychrophila TaxID=1759441 RepID=A0A166JFJ7_9AGAM|nr:hypothetical protein FIBSPDRAFT_789082 [Fibularhizoctonia sp. CBS 109695]
MSRAAVSRKPARIIVPILEPTRHALVCADDSDVTFRSCDGMLFKVHRNNLTVHSEGFPPPDGTNSQDETVPLTESGDTLELLFQFMYPQRQPDLKKIEFKQLAELAEAAEKYQVYAAIGVCNIYMRSHLEHSFEVMFYAARHGYMDIMDKTEKIILEVPLSLAFEKLTLPLYIAWTRYYAQWLDLIGSLHRFLKTIPHHGQDNSGRNHLWFQSVISQLDTPASLLKLDDIFRAAGTHSSGGYTAIPCPTCQVNIASWRKNDMEPAIQRMGHLSSFL